MLGVGIYLSVISADIAGDSIVSAASHGAGQWELISDSADAILGGRAVIDQDRQARSWSYKHACYSLNGKDSDCNIFYSKRLPISSKSNATCPFDGDACLHGNASAFEVTTGLFDTNLLGVNAPAPKRFFCQRTMSCSPLKSDEPYVLSSYGPKNSSYPNQWLYNYGPALSDEYTLRNGMEWQLSAETIDHIPSYSMGWVFPGED
jgi:hypothetical protein